MTTSVDAAVKVHKALGHATRVRILAMLRGGELCVCQINAVIGLAPSTMSAHLGELKDAGLVGERKAGRWVHYRLTAEGAAEEALQALFRTIAGDLQVDADARFLAHVTAHPVEAICRPEFDLPALRRACCPPGKPETRT